MQKSLKVLIGDNTVPFGMECRSYLANFGVDVSLVPKDGSRNLPCRPFRICSRMLS